jgi:hypothetical protein
MLVISSCDSKVGGKKSFHSRFDTLSIVRNLFTNNPQVRTQCGINASFLCVNITASLRVQFNFPTYGKCIIHVMLNIESWVVRFQVDYTLFMYSIR